MAKAHYSKRPAIGLSFALYSLLLEFAARELLIGRRQERIIWLADAAADIKTERCDWLRVKPGKRWLAIDQYKRNRQHGGPQLLFSNSKRRRLRKLRKRKEMNGTEEKLWKWEIWHFKVETSKFKLRKLRIFRLWIFKLWNFKLESINCESWESSNLETPKLKPQT